MKSLCKGKCGKQTSSRDGYCKVCRENYYHKEYMELSNAIMNTGKRRAKTPKQTTKYKSKREQDMLKLEKAFFENLQREQYCEYGGIGLDDKRPFGNSFVEDDILNIIGERMLGNDGEDDCWSKEQLQYANNLYNDLTSWIQKRYSEVWSKMK